MARKLFDARREQALQQALFLRLSVALERKLTRIIRGTYDDAADKLLSMGSVAASAAVLENRSDLKKALYSHGDATARIFAKRLRDGMKSAYPDHIRKQESAAQRAQREALEQRVSIFGVTFDTQLTAFLTAETATRVVQISTTTAEHIQGIVQSGLSEGMTLDDTAKEIRKLGPQFSRYRAHVIARTESHTTANAGMSLEADASEFDMRKQWLSARDERTRRSPPDRFDHFDSATNGQTVDQKEPFNVSGEQLMFPGDPRGSAGNIVNCRCAQGFIIV